MKLPDGPKPKETTPVRVRDSKAQDHGIDSGGAAHKLVVQPSNSEMAHHFHDTGCKCGKCA